MRVLVIAPDFPYPPSHGGRVDIASSIQALRSLGLEVHLLCTTKTLPEPDALQQARNLCASVKLVPRRLSPGRFCLGYPYQVASRRGLACVDLGSGFDFALLHSEYISEVLNNPGLKVGKVLLRIHNDECAYFSELARSAQGWRRAYYWLESRRWRRLIRNIHARVDHLLYISRDELARAEPTRTAASWLPAGLDLSSMAAFNPDARNVLFLGSLFMPNNRAGLDWYLRNVHPLLVDEPAYQLIIAGNSGRIRLPIADWEGLGKIRVVPDPSEAGVLELYGSAAVFIAPIRYSGGVKIKVLNALLAGLGVVTTDSGVEGSGLVDGEHVLVSRTAEDFAQAVATLLRDPVQRSRLVTAAQKYLRNTYDQTEVLRQALKIEEGSQQ